MKKLICFLLLLVMMVTMVACDGAKTEDPAEDGAETKQTFMEYGKKYVLLKEGMGKREYVFEEDHTGYCVVQHTVISLTHSGRVDFVWREASDGAVYLFETKTTYNEDHTAGMGLDLISGAIYFGEEFFAYSNSCWVIEGSALAENMKK